MQYTLSETLEENGPTAFPTKLLSKHPDLYRDRVALFFTPTANLPPRVVGRGPLDVFLPLCTPDYYECFFIRSYMSPRLWVDLLQRHTRFIRWTPFPRATVTITRYDTSMLRQDHLVTGTKALLDALKVQTYGRKDGHPLYYFGAIRDDSAAYVTVTYRQGQVPTPEKSGVRLTVCLDEEA
jgi:hypothetical protein